LSLISTSGDAQVAVVDVSSTDLRVQGSPQQNLVLRLEGLGLDGQEVISSGQSGPFDLDLETETGLDVLFARRGEFTRLLENLGYARFGHSATALADGRVLIFGGASGGDWDVPVGWVAPEIYDPQTQQGCMTADRLCPAFAGSDLRMGHTATATSSGEVLVFGGETEQAELVRAILVFDPSQDAFREMSNYDPKRVMPRSHHTAEEFNLSDSEKDAFRDMILICGGEIEGEGRRLLTDSCLVYDATTESFTQTDLNMSQPRKNHTATAFSEFKDKVLLAGGEGTSGLLNGAEIFNGSEFEEVVALGEGASSRLGSPRLNHRAVAIDRDVVFVGGDNGIWSLDSPEIFIDEKGERKGFFQPPITASNTQHSTRRGLVSFVLPTDEIIYAAGERLDGIDRVILNSVETLMWSDSEPGFSFSDLTRLEHPLSFATITVLANGAVLITGGLTPGPGGLQASAEVWYYNP